MAIRRNRYWHEIEAEERAAAEKEKRREALWSLLATILFFPTAWLWLCII